MREPTNEVEVERDVAVPMPDGEVLLTDLYHPVGVADAPTILERTPYGRRAISALMAPEFASRGYRYVVQACRGTDGSGGSHSYFAEAADGRATADWLAERPWFNGALGTCGASYMGFTQWALASTEPPHLKAMAVCLATTRRSFSWYPGDSLALELMLAWDAGAVRFNKEPTSTPDVSPEAVERRMAELRAGFDHLPLGEALLALTGEDLPLYQDQLAHAGLDDPHWAPLDFADNLAGWKVPTLLVEGWQDYCAPRVFEDFMALRRAPAPVRLRVGGGGHVAAGGPGGVSDAPLEWFDRHLLGRRDAPAPAAVTIEVQGEGGGWRDLDDWPPAAEAVRWHLHPGGRLAQEPSGPSSPDRYRYDPADPTPSVGGIGLLSGGAVENRPLEARDDVVVYTTDVLTEPLVVIGPVAAQLSVATSGDHVDFFVRLCDVAPDGGSTNVCDGLQRFTPASIVRDHDGTFSASVELWPAGHRFAAGHRLQVLVASGAHPVYVRNLGTGEPLATATTLCPVEVALHHDPGHRSFVTLPHVVETSS